MILDADVRDTVKDFFVNNIIEIDPGKPFLLRNGRTSPVRINHQRVFSLPVLRQRVVAKWAEVVSRELRSRSERNFVVVGTAPSGVAPGYALADKLGCGFVYVRERPDNGGQFIEGLWSSGVDAIVVDDLVTTGKSILTAVETIRGEGGNVLFGTSISLHDFRATLSKFSEANISLISLFRTTDLFDTAYGMGLLGSREMRAIMQWMADEDINIM